MCKNVARAAVYKLKEKGVEILEVRGGGGDVWRVPGGAWRRDLFDRVAEKLEALFGATVQIRRCSLSL